MRTHSSLKLMFRVTEEFKCFQRIFPKDFAFQEICGFKKTFEIHLIEPQLHIHAVGLMVTLSEN